MSLIIKMDAIKTEEHLRIAPCRRCARNGKDRIDGMRMCFHP